MKAFFVFFLFLLPAFFSSPCAGADLQFNPTRSLTAGWPGDLPDKTRVAYNSRHREYLVVYQYHNSILPGPDQIHAARLSASGEYIANYVISDLPNSCIEPDVEYDPLFDRYLVVWSYTTTPLNVGTGHDWDIYGRFIPWSGPTDTLNSFEIAAGLDEYQTGGVALSTDDRNPRIAYSKTGKTFFVVLEEYTYPAYDKPFITGTKVSADGATLWQNLSILLGRGFSIAHPDVAWDSLENEFMVVFDIDDPGSRMVYGVFVPGDQAPGTHEELIAFSQLTPVSTGQMLYGGHSLPAVSFCPVTNMYLIAWVTNRHVDSGEIFARYLPSRAFVQPSATSYLERLDTHDFVNLVDVACGANTGHLPNDRRTGDCLVTWTLRHDNSFWSFGRHITLVTSPIAQLFSHNTGFIGPLQNLGALSSWSPEEPAIGVANSPENFCATFIGLDNAGNRHAFSRTSKTAEKKGWKSVAAGWYHSLGIRADGSLYAWGANFGGQLGLGSTMLINKWPARIGTWNDWVAVAGGSYHSLGIRKDGSLWAWGANNYGQLGLGDEVDRNIPARVGTWNDWVTVVAGDNYSLGVRADGSLWAWGDNNEGQLGVGDTTERKNPVRVGMWHTWNDWIYIAAGEYHSFGIRADGSLYAWGKNDDGALGLGGITQVTAPTKVNALSDWIRVTAGEYHSLGIRGGDLLYGWGNNEDGQLGLGDTNNRDTPAKVGSLSSWDYWNNIGAGRSHSLGIHTDGSLWAWGLNNTYQLGTGSDTSDQNRPVQVGIWNDWLTVSAGSHHSLGIRADGSLYAWGWNGEGQLGLGNIMAKSTPTRVLLPGKFPWSMFLPAIISGKK